jgi:hypothetical protein
VAADDSSRRPLGPHLERRAGGFRTVDVEGERPPEPATAG